jgi:hypothetical protein
VDTDEHEALVTREVSGANRYWRLFLDGVLLGGPTNDATYSTATHIGVNCDEQDRIAELEITS